MIQFNRFPEGRKRVVTFSYDDGPKEDARLVDLFNRYGVKATFHLNGMRYRGADEATLAAVRARYAGHEISCHTVQHGCAADMPPQALVREITEDREILERIAGYPVIGMSYPNGSYDRRVQEVLRACGIVYSRTVCDTGRQDLPEDFLAWHPTCHHRNALPLARRFMETLNSEWIPPLFYVWGHAFEFRTEEDWAAMEEIVAAVAGDERVWYATNAEIWRYVRDLRLLEISADEHLFYNPTASDLWVERDKKEVLRIPAGAHVRL